MEENEVLIEMYRKMLRIRYFEEKIKQLERIAHRVKKDLIKMFWKARRSRSYLIIHQEQ